MHKIKITPDARLAGKAAVNGANLCLPDVEAAAYSLICWACSGTDIKFGGPEQSVKGRKES